MQKTSRNQTFGYLAPDVGEVAEAAQRLLADLLNLVHYAWQQELDQLTKELPGRAAGRKR